jgi:hypothetical protein
VATYFNDCASLTGWTEVAWATGTQFSIDTGDILSTGTSGGGEILNLDAIDSDADRDDIEIYCEFTRPGNLVATYREITAIRGSGDSTTGTCYVAFINEANVRISRYTSPNAVTTISSAAHSMATSGVDYGCRFRVNGGDLKLRFWELAGGEPGTWQIEVNNTVLTAAGYAGPLSPDANVSGARYYKFGIGTNGDTAPTSAPATGSFAFSRAFPRPILNF